MKLKNTLSSMAILSAFAGLSWFALSVSSKGLSEHQLNHREAMPSASSLGQAQDASNKNLSNSQLASLQARIQRSELALAAAEEAIANAEEALIEELEDEDQEQLIAGWQVDNGDLYLAEPSIPLGEVISEYQVVKTQKPSPLPAAGDKLELPLLNGETATVEVKRTQTMDNGDYSWSGHLEGHGTDFPVVVTYGEKASFAMITTPQGSYSLESINGLGYLYKNPSEEELTTPGHQDFLEFQH